MSAEIRLYIKINISENNLKKFLNSKFEGDPYKKKVGYFFSRLLYEGVDNPANLFILNFNKKTDSCFIVYAPRNLDKSKKASFIELFEVLGNLVNNNTSGFAVFATPFPEFVEGYSIKNNNVVEINSKNKQKEVVEKLHHKFWSFSDNADFPEPKVALTKRNYLDKNFKNYYKRYLTYIEEFEKPNKIASAIKENPYHLFDDFYTYENKVFQFRKYTNQVIEIPQACPLTFRNVSGILADKNYVFLSRLSDSSPPITIKEKSFTINNPNAIWEFYTCEGVDGESFDYVKEKWDTIYWKDKNSVFIYLNATMQLKKMAQADHTTFKYLGFCFGKDKNHIFYYDTVLPIRLDNYSLDKNGFIYDENSIFHYQNHIPLNAQTFKVINTKRTKNPFNPTYVLEDKNGKYEYNRIWKNGIIKPFSKE